MGESQIQEEDLNILLNKLDREETSLLEARTSTQQSSLTQSLRDVDRCLEHLRRALPELDIVSKTSGELRTSIKKTMDRANLVSVRVRELDQSRSRALEALEYANRCLDCRSCVEGARTALARNEVEKAAGYAKRFDDIAKGQKLLGYDDMESIRAELERLILETAETNSALDTTSLREAAHRDDWLECDTTKEALKQASVMAKVSDVALAETKYAQFLATLFKERISHEFARVNFEKLNETVGNDSKQFIDFLKYVFNSAAALIEVNTRLPEQILPKSTRITLFRAVHNECDKQCALFFDTYMSHRRLHERAANSAMNKDLTKLNQLLVEICLCLQNVETYDRFVRSRPFLVNQDATYNCEYRRIVQEIAGVYTLLEKIWITESLKKATKLESTVDILVSGRVLKASSLVEDAFFVCGRALKRSLGTGSSDASCGCVNLIIGCLEDALLSLPATTGSLVESANAVALPSMTPEDGSRQINSYELSIEYCQKLFTQISTTDAFERSDDLVKVTSCAEGLFDLSNKLEMKKYELIVSLVTLISSTSPQWKTALEGIEKLTYDLDETTFERDDFFASRFSTAITAVLNKQRDFLSEGGFERIVEFLAFRCAEDIEKGVVPKRFSQLGALKFDRDIRSILETCVTFVGNSLTVRAVFARLLQISSLLGVALLEEAHDVWDSFTASSSSIMGEGVSGIVTHQKFAVRPKDKLTAKEAKRILALRLDFDQRDVQRMKLI